MMKQATAPTSLSVKIVTGGVLALNLGLYIAAIYRPEFPVIGIFLSLIVLACYLFWTPVLYELNGDELTVFFRVGRVRYRPVVKCSPQDSRIGFGLRLFGNGGVFAGSGIFWSRRLGVFRGYVTTSKPGNWVLVETDKTKILISPAEPQAWVMAR
jgi:hypothetical protein